MSKILIESILIPYTNKERTIRIYLPDGYNDSNDNYPVIYMHDGQNLFDKETSSYGHIWDIHTFLDTLDKGYIVVGIDNYEGGVNRLHEYSPWVNSDDVGGLGTEYVKFIVEDLKPYVDSTFRTKPEREHTGIIGSSMGGLISIYAGIKYPEVFSKIGAFSTAVWFAEAELLEFIKNYKSSLTSKWYLDIGTKETSNDENNEFNLTYLNGTMKTFETLKNIGVKEKNIMLVVEEGGVHNEEYWAKRFPKAFRFLYE